MTTKINQALWLYLTIIVLCAGAASSSFAESPMGNAKAGEVDEKKLTSPVVSPGKEEKASQTSNITNVSIQESNDGVSITLESSGNIQYTAFKLQNPLRLVLDIPKTQKGVMGDKVEVKKGVVESIRPLYFDESEVLRLEFSLNQPTGYEINRLDSKKLVINLRESAKDASQVIERKTTTTAAEPKKTDNFPSSPDAKTIDTSKTAFSEEACYKFFDGNKEPISMDFQNAQLSNVFRVLSEVGGFNVVLSPSIQGTTNVRLEKIPWNHAMELILKNNGLIKQCYGNIVRVVSSDVVTKEETARSNAKNAKWQANLNEMLAGDLSTEVVGINYSDIKELAKSLETIKSKRGQVVVDIRTNTFVLTDVHENLDAMVKVVKSLDRPTRQVVIEARIVEINRNAARELGVQWGAQGTAITNYENPSTVKFGSTSKANPGFIVDFASAAISPGSAAGIGLSLGSLTKDFILDLQLTALETAGKGRVLSTPKVTTTDNKEAKIQSGRKIPYATVSQQGTAIQFVDASIELTVTPHITEDQHILMKIQAKKNAADFSDAGKVNGVPSITTKEATTEVLVRNGETTVLGGLYENTVEESEKGVPGLSKLPLLGYLFKNKRNSDVVSELLIFITPTVVKNF